MGGMRWKSLTAVCPAKSVSAVDQMSRAVARGMKRELRVASEWYSILEMAMLGVDRFWVQERVMNTNRSSWRGKR